MTEEEPENLQIYLPKHAQTATLKKPEERIAAGEYCPRCGYDLRGIIRGHPCPECGRPTKHAGALGRGGGVIGDYDCEYLKRIRLGLWFIMVWWLMVVVVPLLLVVTQSDAVALYTAVEIGMGIGITGAYYISKVPSLLIAAGVKRSRWFMVALTIALLALGAIIEAHYQVATASVFVLLARLSSVAQWQFFGLLFIMIFQILLCLKGQRLADSMGDEALGRKFWNLAWILPASIIFTYLMAALLLHSLLGLLLLCFTIVPFAAVGSEIAFILFVNSLQNDFAWAIRYQYDDAARQERLRRKKGTVGVVENNEDDRNTQ